MSDEVMFGTPETWGLKVGEFIETQLPKEKPKELLDLQEQNRKQRLLDSLQKIGPGLMDESLDFIRREEFAEGSVAMRAVKKYINTLPEGTLVTKDLIEKFYKDNNLTGSKDFQHILNKVRGSQDIKPGINFEESKKVTTRRREFDDLGVKLKKVNPAEPLQFIGKKDDITGITDKRFQREYKLTKNGQNFVDNFNALVDAYDGSFKFTPDRISIAIKAAGGDPKYRNVLKSKIGAPTSPVRNKLKVAKENPEKIKNYIKNVILNPETKWQELEGGSLNKHLAIKFDATNRYIDKVLSTVGSPDPEIPQLVKENKRLFNFLNSNEFRKKFGTKKSRIQTIGDIQEFAEMRPKGLASYTARSKNPGMFIFDSAFRNFTQAMDAQDAGKNVTPKVKFIGDPRVQNPSEWKFVYKNKTFGFNNVEGNLTDREMAKNALPESARTINDLGTTTEAGKLKYGKIFPEVYSIFEDKAKYDSTTYKGKQLDWYRRNIKADITGDEWRRKMPSVEIDHFKGVGKNPFDNLRLLDRDVNSSAGNLFRSYQAGNISKKDYDIGLETLGFNEEYKGVDDFINNRVKELETETVKIPKVKEAFAAIEKKPTAMQELMKRTGAGIDPILAAKAGYEEILKPIGKGALTTAKVLGQPSIAAAFAADELSKGNIKTGGAALLAPELAGSFAPKGRGLLSLAGRIAANPFGKAARAFTPVGLATIGAGALYDVYKEYERRQALTDEERLEEDIERDRAASEMMVGAAEGGRISLKDGPDKKGLKSPSRRNFLKTTGKIAGIAALLPFGIGKGIKMTQKAAPVVGEGFKLGMDKLMILVDKIKLLGKDVTPKYGTKEREQVTLYQGKDGSTYELSEDLSTGDIRVVRDVEGGATVGDESFDTIQDRSEFMITRGRADETTKGKKPPDEYEEGRAVFDQDGTVADIDDVDDSVIEAIEDEIN